MFQSPAQRSIDEALAIIPKDAPLAGAMSMNMPGTKTFVESVIDRISNDPTTATLLDESSKQLISQWAEAFGEYAAIDLRSLLKSNLAKQACR